MIPEPLERAGLCCGSIPQADLLTLAEVAASAGFASITAWPTLVTDAVEAGATLGTIRRRLDDLGITLEELDPLCTWLPVDIPASSPVARFAAYGEDELFGMASELGVGALNVIRADHDQVPDHVMVEHLGALADRAAGAGLEIRFEFLPWSPVGDLAHAVRIVRTVGRSNCGVHVDLWHHVRSGGTIEQLGQLRPDDVAAVQLSDVEPEPWDDVVRETTQRRHLPGDGAGLAPHALEALRGAGITAPVNLEVFRAELMALSPRDAAERLANSCLRSSG